MMDNRIETKISELNNELIKMGALCENAIAASVKALLENDKELAKKVSETGHEIDKREKDIESLCMQLLLRYHPVASDLRNISSALKMITDMERIGDQAEDIAEIVGFTHLNGTAQQIGVSDMAKAAIKMVNESIDAFVKRDTEMAHAVIAYDDVVDALFLEAKNAIIEMMMSDKKCSEAVVDILMIAKYLERIADHAVNIAGWVVYSVTGKRED